jgi:hypothetical protein
LPRKSGATPGSASGFAERRRKEFASSRGSNFQTLCATTLAFIMLFAFGALPACAGERLEIWPIVDLSEEFTDNLPLALVNTAPAGSSQPPLFPVPPLPSPPPVNTKPPVIAPSTRSSNASTDAISLATFGASAALESETSRVAVDYLTDAQLYARNSDLDRTLRDEYVDLRSESHLSEATSLSLTDTLIDGQPVFGQALIGPSGASPLLSQGLLQGRFFTNAFDSRLNHDFGERASIEIDAHQTLFSASSAETSESFAQGGEIGAHYRLDSLLSIGPSLDFQDFRFSSQPRSDSYRPSVGAIWRVSPSLEVSATAGPLVLISPTETRMDVGYTLLASYVRERLQVSINTGRVPSVTAGFSGAGVNQFMGASWEYRLSRLTSVYANSSYSEISARGVSEHVITYGAGISYQLTRSVSVYGQFLRFQTNSPTISRSSTNTLTFGVKLTPKPWIWSF